MPLRNRATSLIAGILALVVVVIGGLYVFSQNGQFAPASSTGGATKSDQRDATVSNDVANHKR